MQYDLVFEGGGAKGMVFAGSMQAFESAGHTYDRLLGTSAGAITATLLAAGYNNEQMLAALAEQKNGESVFAGFLGMPGPFEDHEIKSSAIVEYLSQIDIPLIPDSWEEKASIGITKGLLKIGRFRNLFSFVEKGGWYSASRFVEWLTEKLNTTVEGGVTGFGGMTMAQFFEATGRELCLIASDTTEQRMLVLNHRTVPDCPLIWAVRMSMSIPLVWAEVEWNKDWGLYREQDMTNHRIVDGGILSNFPIELLVSKQPNITAVMGDKKSKHVLGFLIDETASVPGSPPLESVDEGFDIGKLRTGRRLRALIDTMTSAHDKEVIEAFDELVVRLPAMGYGTMEFGMTPQRREALISAGRQATNDYFRKVAEPKRHPKGLPISEMERREVIADRIANRILDR